MSKILPLLVSFIFFIAPHVFAKHSIDLRTFELKVQTSYGTVQFLTHGESYNKEYVARVYAVAKEYVPKVVEYFKYVPSAPIHIVLDDEANIANGSATVFPLNRIELFLAPPKGVEHLTINKDPIKGLFIHEFIHIIQLDQARGVLGALTTVFGAAGKLGGITPRWFTEGIATWGESHFTSDGRLRNALMRSELYSAFTSKDACKYSDCLDFPQEYPHGSLSYWAGGFFLDYLENKKEGTIRCLTIANSRKIPFFLNMSFEECTGDSVEASFQKFRKDFIAEEERSFKSYKKLGLERISLKTDYPVWQKNTILNNSSFIYTSRTYDTDYLHKLDLVSKKEEVERIDYWLEGIENPTLYSLKSKNYIFSVLDSRRIDSTRSFKNSDGEIVGKDYRYYYEFSKKVNVGVDYKVNQWHIYKNDKLIYKAAPLESIAEIHPYKEGLLFRAQVLTSTGDGLSEWRYYDIKANKIKKLFVSKADYLMSCNSDLILKDDKSFYFFNMNNKSFKKRSFRGFEKDIVALKGDKKKLIYHLAADPRSIYVANSGCESLVGSKGPKVKREVSKIKTESFEKAIEKEGSFYPIKYMVPKYWFFNFQLGSDNLDFYSIITSFGDARDNHFVSLNASYYSDLKKFAPFILYKYQPSEAGMSLSYLRSYSVNSFSSDPNEEDEFEASLFYDDDFYNWNLRPSVIGGFEKVNDAFSDREIKKYGFRFDTIKRPYLTDSFLQDIQAMVEFTNNEVEGYNDFTGIEGYLDTNYRPFKRLRFQLRGSYGKLNKSGLKSGVIYGGGYTTAKHPFYGLDYSDLAGNEIWTARFQTFFNFSRAYSGMGMFPLFFKEFDFLIGTDFAGADLIDLDKAIKSNDQVQSYFWGVRSKVAVGYLVPVNIDLIFATVDDDQVGRVNSSFLNITSSFF